MKQHVKQALKLRKWIGIGHHIPGRIRLKYKLGIITQVVSFKQSEIEQAIASIPAFKNYKINTSTGSIVLEYDASVIAPQLIDELFSGSEQRAEQVCYEIAECLNFTGEE